VSALYGLFRVYTGYSGGGSKNTVTEEEQLVRAFFLPEKQERYCGFLKTPKLRRKFFVEMAHFKGLDQRYQKTISSGMQTVEGIAELLRRMGALQTCLVLSDHKDVDGAKLPLEEALATVMYRTFGTFLSCKTGRLGYFENEDGRWILQRN
jgi:hypothetical protein